MKMRLNDKGFTLAEILISFAFLTVVLLSFLFALNMYRFTASYSRHKVQAVYWAQSILEEKRRSAFPLLVSSAFGAIALDPNATFANAADDYVGTATVTVQNIDAFRKKVQVRVDWRERSPFGMKMSNAIVALNKSEFLTTDIANEPELN